MRRRALVRFPTHVTAILKQQPSKVCLCVCLWACQSVFFSLLPSSSPPPPGCVWKTSQVRERLGSCMLPVGTTAHAKKKKKPTCSWDWANIYEPCILKRSCGKMFTKGNAFFFFSFLEGLGMYDMAIKFICFLPHSLALCSSHPEES